MVVFEKVLQQHIMLSSPLKYEPKNNKEKNIADPSTCLKLSVYNLEQVMMHMIVFRASKILQQQEKDPLLIIWGSLLFYSVVYGFRDSADV